MFVHGVADSRVGCFIGSQCSESGVCVYREGTKVSHYIINSKTGDSGAARFHIGDMVFPSIPELLTFYKTHYLDTTALIRPVC